MTDTLADTSTIRQPSPRGGMSLGELLDESWKGHMHWSLLREQLRDARTCRDALDADPWKATAQGTLESARLSREIASLERELDTLNTHLDAIEVEINEHPQSQWRRIEAIEALRLGR